VRLAECSALRASPPETQSFRGASPAQHSGRAAPGGLKASAPGRALRQLAEWFCQTRYAENRATATTLYAADPPTSVVHDERERAGRTR
jgi:hypothetical protein